MAKQNNCLCFDSSWVRFDINKQEINLIVCIDVNKNKKKHFVFGIQKYLTEKRMTLCEMSEAKRVVHEILVLITNARRKGSDKQAHKEGK